MTTDHRGLIESLAAWPTGREASGRPPSGWVDDPVLAGFAAPSDAVRACRDDPGGDQVLGALAARQDDPTATLAALAGLAARLVLISARWRGGGLAGPDLADAEADLVTECLAALRAQPALPARLVVRVAWHRVCGRARTARARSARHVPLPDVPDYASAPDDSDPHRRLVVGLAGAVADTTLTCTGAQTVWLASCGWTGAEAAVVLGCSPAAFRARHARALRALVAATRSGVR